MSPVRTAVAVGAIAVTAVFATLSTACGDRSATERHAATPGPHDDPGFPVPDRAQAEQSLKFLEGEGAALLVIHRTALRLAGGLTAAECRQLADTLDRDAPYSQVILLAAAVTDELLQNLFAGEASAVGAHLTACIDGTPVSTDVEPLGEGTRLVQRRLDELAAAR